MSNAFESGLLAGYGIAIPLGAIAVLIVTTAARESFAQGAAAGFGAATADLTYATIAVAAGAALSPALRPLATGLRVGGGCLLAVVAIRGLVGAIRERGLDERTTAPDRRALIYARFLGLTLINPLTVVYFASIVLANQTAVGAANDSAFVAGVGLASASWQLVLAAGGAAVGSVLVDRGRIVTAMVGYGIVLALALARLSSGL